MDDYLNKFGIMLQVFGENEKEFFKSSACEMCSSIHDHLKHLIDEGKKVLDEKRKKEINEVLPLEKKLNDITPLPLSESKEDNEEVTSIDSIGSDEEASPSKSNIKSNKNKSKKNEKTLRPSIISAGGQILEALESTPVEEGDDRLLMSKMEPIKVETKNNIAAAVLGKDNGEATLDFFLYSKNTNNASRILFYCFCLGHILGTSSLFKIISPEIGAIGSLFTFPNVFVNVCLPLITDILKLLFQKFDSWYMIYNVLGATIGLCLLLQDLRMIYVIVIGFIGNAIIFMDALPSGLRRITQINGLGFTIIILVIVQIGLYYNWFQVENVEYNLGAIKMTASGFAATCNTNVLVYFVKNFVSALLHPERLVVIKAPVVTEKVNKIVSRVIRSAFNIEQIKETLEETKNN